MTNAEAKPQPVLFTKRLTLRPFTLKDCDAVQVICSEKEIAANTRTFEHPYPDGAAKVWIDQHAQFWHSGHSAVYAVCETATSELVGAVGIEIQPQDENGELGYWVAKPRWGEGIATEAAARMVKFGFEELGLYRIFAHYMFRNPASGRVLKKVGMVEEGRLRGHVKKWGVFEDIVVCGVLRRDFV